MNYYEKGIRVRNEYMQSEKLAAPLGPCQGVERWNNKLRILRENCLNSEARKRAQLVLEELKKRTQENVKEISVLSRFTTLSRFDII